MPQPTVQLHILFRRIIARVCTLCRFRTLIGPRNTIKNNSIVSPLQKWIFSYKAMNNRTEATEVSNFRKIMKSFGWEKSLSGEKSFGGEKSMGRNHSVGRNLWGEINGEKSMGRNLWDCPKQLETQWEGGGGCCWYIKNGIFGKSYCQNRSKSLQNRLKIQNRPSAEGRFWLY